MFNQERLADFNRNQIVHGDGAKALTRPERATYEARTELSRRTSRTVKAYRSSRLGVEFARGQAKSIDESKSEETADHHKKKRSRFSSSQNVRRYTNPLNKRADTAAASSPVAGKSAASTDSPAAKPVHRFTEPRQSGLNPNQ